MTNPSKSRTRTMCGEADGLAANGWLIMDRLMCVCECELQDESCRSDERRHSSVYAFFVWTITSS